jgi:ribosomal protein S18
MSDETKMTEAEANTEEQPANETPTEDSGVAEHLATAEQDAPLPEESAAESAPQVVAEAVAEPVTEAAAEPVAEAVAEPEAEAVAEPVAEAVAEPVAEAVAEPEAEPVAETVSEGAEEAADEASAESDADSSQPEQPVISFNRVEGPAIFNRAKQGNQRRNPRHVGNDVRIDEIGYKNVQVLSRFVDNYGRIHNRRKTRVTAKMQRKVTRAIKRARHLALMPYTGEHIRITGRRG